MKDKIMLGIWIIFVFFIVIVIVVGAPTISDNIHTVFAEDGRPTVPTINTYAFPPGSLDGEPAGLCWSNCGVLCFYISENVSADHNEWELSCMPWDFDLGSPLNEGQGK